MLKLSIKLSFLFALVTVSVTFCKNDEQTALKAYSQNPEDYSTTLIVFPDAENVIYSKMNENDAVVYNVSIEYPAPNVVSYLSRHLENMGYRPLRESYLNPGIPSSHVRGWTGYRDISVTPEKRVRQWLAEWQNEDGNLVFGALRYENPVGREEDLTNLKVFVSYYPASVAKAMLEASAEDREKLEVPSKEREK